MARFEKKLSFAEKCFDRTKRLRSNGRHDLVKPLESYRVDHNRVDDAWRHRKSKDVWRGAKGKQKRQFIPKS